MNLENRDWPFRKGECAVCAARMPYRNVQTDCSLCHGATTFLVASQPRTRSKYENGRVRSPLGMSKLASAAHWSWLALIWASAQLNANRRAPHARRNTAACTLVGFRRSRTLAVLVAETGLLTGIIVPGPADMAPTPISHTS